MSRENFELTKTEVGYVPLAEATENTYLELGFKSGLEVHQQLKTDFKLFCRCPSGQYHVFDDYDAKIVRHMRPTLSELGEYDGTALMEFRTKKNITYRLNHKTACTYDIDDTPPFLIDQKALEIAIKIALLLDLKIVGELHVTRKQYLDGSIPTGFQRTGIIGIDGSIRLKRKKVSIIQLSIEEDSCREISDCGHERIYSTDRLGTPLIETVTGPELLTPYEVRDAAHHIRFLARSTGLVRVGSGAGRQDVNVSVEGGTRVEIKGVSHILWIPQLTHREAFRQKSLLLIKEKITKRKLLKSKWKINSIEIELDKIQIEHLWVTQAREKNLKLIAVNLPGFKGLLSHFTQPGLMFVDEISDQLKVIACLEKPNLLSSEAFDEQMEEFNWDGIRENLQAKETDAQILFWTSDYDLKTALETIEERCLMAFVGVPNETRKALPNGNTIFERVLPGANRMYPDTDSVPLPIDLARVDQIRSTLPVPLKQRYKTLKQWKVPVDGWGFILRNNLMDLIEQIISEFHFSPKQVSLLFAHRLKFIQGQIKLTEPFDFKVIYNLYQFVYKHNLQPELVSAMLPTVFEHPNMDFESVLITIGFKKHDFEEIYMEIPALVDLYYSVGRTKNKKEAVHWIMGKLRPLALGNVSLKELHKKVLGICQSLRGEECRG